MTRAADIVPPSDGRVALAMTAVVAGAACFGTLPLFTRMLTEAGLAPPAIAFWRFALTAVVLLPLLRLRGGAWRPTLWAMAGGAGMGLGWIGFVHSLTTMSIAEAGVLFMTYPVFAILFAGVLFGVRPRPAELVATGLIVLAAVLAAPAGTPAGVPIGGAVLSAIGLARQAFVATQAVTALVMHVFKIVVFGLLGFVFAPWLGLILAMIASGFIGTLAGTRVLARMPETIFRTGFRLVMTLLAGSLLLRGLADLFTA